MTLDTKILPLAPTCNTKKKKKNVSRVLEEEYIQLKGGLKDPDLS